MCRIHYWRVKRHGTTDLLPFKNGPVPVPAEVRFWAKVVQSGECWLWTGSTTLGGYGSCHHSGERLAHRWAYENMVGPIPDGLHLDHLCRVRACVNPYHLEPVTPAVNNSRVDYTAFHEGARRAAEKENAARRARALAATHCKHGHPWDEANTNWSAGGTRLCKRCAAIATRKYLDRKKAS